MAQFLLELFSEEIPARMQAGAARDLDRLARAALSDATLSFDDLRAFAGPRRLTLVVDGLPAAQADRAEERKGPRVGAPDAAVEGFLRATGLARDALTQRDGAWFALIARAGRPTAEILGEMTDAIVRKFPWPKSMTWGAGTLRWVRPLHRILAVFDGAVVPVEIDGIVADDMSEGHRVMGSKRPFAARNFDAYRAALAENFVVLDADERKARILAGARALCAARGLTLVEDVGLLDEVAGMAEWPVPILGHIEDRFLKLPPEVIRTSMRVHQRYFAVRWADDVIAPKFAHPQLAPQFIAVANLEPTRPSSSTSPTHPPATSPRLLTNWLKASTTARCFKPCWASLAQAKPSPWRMLLRGWAGRRLCLRTIKPWRRSSTASSASFSRKTRSNTL